MQKRRWGLIALSLVLVICALVMSNIGALSLTWTELASLPFDNPAWQIWLNIRLPRIVLAITVGMALAVSGTLFQGLFHNPMADPSLIGVNSGAALAVAVGILLPNLIPSQFALYSSMLAAFIGSTLVASFIYLLSHQSQASMNKLLLAGIAINVICGAAIGILSYVSSDQQLRQFSLWTMGGLGQVQWQAVIVASLIIVPAILYSFRLAQALNLLQLGDEEAHYLGVRVLRLKQTTLLLGALLVGVSVSVSGAIGFIGLVIPHLVRFKFGADHRGVLPASALCGAILLLCADTLARTLFAPLEVPVGILISLIGAPYFLWLVIRFKEAR
ncbi:iron ABC transporter [Pasteurellaceae bacterium RH1A]|nr:iron ABC transporter [Pasteurellaceae bacterium RH1A]